jgi:hypothetical protein
MGLLDPMVELEKNYITNAVIVGPPKMTLYIHIYYI